jgi:hypothetical protein
MGLVAAGADAMVRLKSALPDRLPLVSRHTLLSLGFLIIKDSELTPSVKQISKGTPIIIQQSRCLC